MSKFKLNKLHGKKAITIGTTATWIVATFIILFILFIYFLGVGFLAKNWFFKPEITLKGQENALDTETTTSLLAFINDNKEAIYQWADGDVLTTEELTKVFADPNTPLTGNYINYNSLCIKYVKFVKSAGFTNTYFYIRTERNEMEVDSTAIEQGMDNSQCSFSINPPDDYFKYSLKPNQLVLDPNYAQIIYLYSDKDNLIKIIFYDKSKVLEIK
ncbi:hypothetical protein J4466_02350 [Candidatus Pacearchaeota archaeon]|nr:hypothetical protein [Candidatus Pacearchaeota archaeon]